MDYNKVFADKLAELRDEGRYRVFAELERHAGNFPRATRNVDGKKQDVIVWCSNDYLGMGQNPVIMEAMHEALDKCGAGAGGTRNISGTNHYHVLLEEELASLHGKEAGLIFTSGYVANLTTLSTIGAMLPGCVIVSDELNHNSMIAGIRHSRADKKIFAHNDLVDLERILKWARESGANTLIITESVFSMDGDIAPLENIVKLKEAYGAWLMLDEAHAVGLYGKGRRGVAEELGVTDQVEVQMGTLGKALGAAGGLICGSQALVDLLINRARSFIYSTAPVPAQAAAALRAIELISSDEGGILQDRLWKNVEQLKNSLTKCGWKLPSMQSAILPLIVGAEDDAVALSQRLLEAGIWVPAVRYPTVARGEARLRVTVSAAHTDEDIEKLLEALGNA